MRVRELSGVAFASFLWLALGVAGCFEQTVTGGCGECAPGAVCGESGHCEELCISDSNCQGSEECIDGVCQAALDDDDDDQSSCTEGVDCDCESQGTCECDDVDEDGYLSGVDCAQADDCNDGNPNVWTSCGSCQDGDNDTYFTGCDAYVNIAGPDCDDLVNTKSTNCPFTFVQSDIESTISFHVEPGIPRRGLSGDGKLELIIPTGAFDRATEVTVGKLKADKRPPGVVSDVYIVGASGATQSKPVRARLTYNPSGLATDTLRPVRVDTGAQAFDVLSSWAHVPATATVAADLGTGGAIAVAGTTGYPLQNNVAATATASADELLAMHRLRDARSAYETLLASDATNLRAHFGAAISRAVLIPEHSELDELFTRCGELPIDMENVLFGGNGEITAPFEARQGDSTVSLQKRDALEGGGFGSFAGVDLVPNRILSELDGSYLEITVEDVRSATTGDGVVVGLYVSDVTNAEWTDGATLTVGASSVTGLRFTNEADEDLEAIDRWSEPVSGTVRVIKAGKTNNALVEIEFQNVVFQRYEAEMGSPAVVVGEFKVNGRVRDTLRPRFEPTPGSVPFNDLEYIPEDQLAMPPVYSKDTWVQAVDACGSGLTVPYLMGKLDAVVGELVTVRSHLDAIAAAPGAASFVWRVPVGAAGNGIAFPIGIAEINLARGALYIIDGVNELVQQYRMLDPATALSSLLADYTEYSRNCYWDPVLGADVCDTSSTLVRDFEPYQLYTALDSHWLTPVNVIDAASMAPVKTRLQLGLAALVAAFDATPPVGDIVVDFQRPTMIAASAELKALLQAISASMNTPTGLPKTPEWLLTMNNFFGAPFDRAELLSATELSSLWFYQPVDDDNLNAYVELEGDVLGNIMERLVTQPSDPETTIFCAGPTDCNVGERTYNCETGHYEGRCSDDLSGATPCYGDGECGSGSCVMATCKTRDMLIYDEAVVDPAINRDPPAFINEPVWDDVEASL